MTSTERVHRHRAKQAAELDQIEAETAPIGTNGADTGTDSTETAAAAEDGWQVDQNGVHFTISPGNDPTGSCYLIHPPDKQSSAYSVFWAIGRAAPR